MLLRLRAPQSNGLLSDVVISSSLPAALTPLIERVIYNVLMQDRPKLLRWAEDLAAPGARAFRRALPCADHAFLRESDRVVMAIFRGMLRIPLYPLPFDCRCPPPCKQLIDVDHAHRCAAHRRRGTTERHDGVARALGEIAAAAGATVYFEQRADPASGRGLKTDVSIDLLLPTGSAVTEERFDIDVSMVHGPVLSGLLSAGFKQRVQQKEGKYVQALKNAGKGIVFKPFVVSSMGTLESQATWLLERLATHAEQRGRATSSALFYREAMLKIQHALHKGNIKMQEDMFAGARPVPQPPLAL